MTSKLIFAAAFSAALASGLSAQQANPNTKADVATFRECEDSGRCGTWTFLDRQGTGQWPSGEVGNLNFEKVQINPDKTMFVVVHRADSTGKSAGLQREYWGTLRNGRICGEYGAPGHRDNPSGVWYAFVTHNQQTLPAKMHFCDQEHCATLLLNDGRYMVQMPNSGYGTSSVWTVYEFNPDKLIMNRRDSSGFTSFYSAPVSSDGNSTLSGESGNASYAGEDAVRQVMRGNFRFTWGSALDSIPGNYAGLKEFTPPQQQAQSGGPSPEETIQMLRFLTALASAMGNN